MSNDDPLAALSAAAKKRSSPSRLPSSRNFAASEPTPYRRPGPKKPKPNYALPIILGVVFLAIAVTAAVIITLQLNKPAPVIVEAPKPKVVQHQPGELFTNVPTQDTTPTKTVPTPPE